MRRLRSRLIGETRSLDRRRRPWGEFRRRPGAEPPSTVPVAANRILVHFRRSDGHEAVQLLPEGGPHGSAPGSGHARRGQSPWVEIRVHG